MNFILFLVAVSFLAVAFSAPEPVEDLRFEVQALTNMVTEQQAELASLKDEVRNSVTNTDFPIYEYDMAEQSNSNLISSISALTDRLAELERRLDDSEDQTGQRFETLQSSIDSYRNDAADATSAVDSNLERVGETNLRQTVFGYVNDSLNQLRMARNGLGWCCKVEHCQAGTVGTKFYNGINHSYPRTYHLVFEPPFKAVPKFTYEMIHLDAKSIVRVDVRVKSLTQSRATIVVSSWTTKNLFGVEVRWMACP